MKNWDTNKKEMVETPENIINFFNDIENVCKKHNVSISHEDTHGAFVIQKYNEDILEWFKNATIDL